MIENGLLRQLMVRKEVKNFKVVLDFWDLERYNQVVVAVNLILVVLDEMDWTMYLVK